MSRNLGIGILAMMSACISHAHAQSSAAPGKMAQPIVSGTQASSEPLEITLVRSKIVLVGGKEMFQDAAAAKPGDIFEEVATYTNKAKSRLRNLEATLPIPANTELQIASVKPGNAKASIDGSEFRALPLKRRVKQANGIEVERPVPVSEYRYLRWYPGDLAAEKSLVFSARFKLSNDGVLTVTPAGK